MREANHDQCRMAGGRIRQHGLLTEQVFTFDPGE
jgi:hypothetical protein